jgi:hypothetical protein
MQRAVLLLFGNLFQTNLRERIVKGAKESIMFIPNYCVLNCVVWEYQFNTKINLCKINN